MAEPDQLQSLYSLGFDVDERLAERLDGAQAIRMAVCFSAALHLDGKAPAFDVHMHMAPASFFAGGCLFFLGLPAAALALPDGLLSAKGPTPLKERVSSSFS